MDSININTDEFIISSDGVNIPMDASLRRPKWISEAVTSYNNKKTLGVIPFLDDISSMASIVLTVRFVTELTSPIICRLTGYSPGKGIYDSYAALNPIDFNNEIIVDTLDEIISSANIKGDTLEFVLLSKDIESLILECSLESMSNTTLPEASFAIAYTRDIAAVPVDVIYDTEPIVVEEFRYSAELKDDIVKYRNYRGEHF